MCCTGAVDQDVAEVATASTMDRFGKCQRRIPWPVEGKHMCKRAERWTFLKENSGYPKKTCDFN